MRICSAVVVGAVGLCIGASAFAGELKPNRISLFSSGVGYFEVADSVDGTVAAEMSFRVEQINDILKSLVLRDMDGGTISAVEYPSRDPVERTLKSFAVDITKKPTLGQLLDQLRGVQVQVMGAQPVSGAILSVEKQRSMMRDGTIVESELLSIMSDEGLKRFDMGQISGVKIVDEKVNGELKKALATLAGSHDADKKTVTLNFSGQGKRRIRVGYILETPVWKTSYRLEIGKDKKPYLQGWAMVENTTEQDWENTRLSLVSGRPISFTMDLYQPLYAPRPAEAMEIYASLRTPTYEGAMAKDKDDEGSGNGGRGLGGARFYDARRKMAAQPPAPAKFAGRNINLGGIGNTEEREGNSTLMLAARDEDIGNTAAGLFGGGGVQGAAATRAAGELFEYKIEAPVNLKRQRSAMLPIVTKEIEGTKVSIFNQANFATHPFNGIKLKNASGLHLMQGPVTVFEAGVYGGDSKLPDLAPDEERLIAYGLDLSVDVAVHAKATEANFTSVRIAKGTMIQTIKSVDVCTYDLKNKNDADRTVLVEHPVKEGWTLVEPSNADEKTATMYRFKVVVPKKGSKSLTVRMEHVRNESVSVSSMGDGNILGFAEAGYVSADVKKALRRVIELRNAVEAVRVKIRDMEREISEVSREQERIRENMKVLQKTSEVYRRYEKKFDTQETRVEKLREELVKERAEEAKRQKVLEDFVMGVDLK